MAQIFRVKYVICRKKAPTREKIEPETEEHYTLREVVIEIVFAYMQAGDVTLTHGNPKSPNQQPGKAISTTAYKLVKIKGLHS